MITWILYIEKYFDEFAQNSIKLFTFFSKNFTEKCEGFFNKSIINCAWIFSSNDD